MKRKIAVLANGWNNISITQALKGIRSVTDELNIDIFLFLSYAAYGRSKVRNIGEDSIFDLPDFKDFDGVITFSNMLNSEETPKRIADRLIKENICAVSVGMPYKGLNFVGINNSDGMYELVDHLAQKHHIKNPAFLAGTRDHPDSIERLETTKKVLALNGVELKEENIRYTDWEYLTSIKYAIELWQSGNRPDAYICANDHNAIGACIGLNNIGVSVPDDVIVTGFDKISHAETFYPSITTVYQDYEKIGYIAAWQLVEQIEGTSKEDHVVVSSKFVMGESCGCKKTSEADEVRHDFCINAYKKEMENILFQTAEADMTTSVFSCSSYDEFQKNLINFHSTHQSIGGGEFYFVIDDNAQKAFKDALFPLKTEYAEKMNCLVAVKDGKAESKGEFTRKELIPNYKKEDKPSVYTFTSMHYDDKIFGYIVTSNALECIKDRTLNHYMLQVNFNLEQYRNNSRLDEMNRALRDISNTDQLTGLNNRFGMEVNAVPLLENAHKNNRRCAIIFADINRMKYINDNFGHLQGDLAIRTVAAKVLELMPKGWVAIRYGGDEFIAVGECTDENDVMAYEECLTKELENEVEGMQLAYPLTISTGHILSDPKSDQNLIDYIHQADSVMYEHKQETYKKGL